jgi:Flp pilus assembly protein TadD
MKVKVWCLAALVAFCLEAPAADVRVWQGVLTLPTYQEGAPDPNPPFDQFAGSRFNYPYTLRTNLTGKRVDTAWRALYLENEYLKCSVLPDIGGHLYTCIDKISGQPMFYANPSIKKAQIGYRGAWAAFGIEFNFPVSHNWVSMSPVDFSVAKNPDGSASIFVGNIDRPYGMQWTVELRLAPASTVLEERVTLYNRSDVRHRYYWWNNAGVRVWDDSRIFYPMRWSAAHGFADVDTWPVNSAGLDQSVIAKQVNGTVSRFVYGSREPFMGVYHPHTATGVVHYADYADLPAKKIWSWGVDADGLDWRRTLSDDNSGYVEVQAGLMRNQETYAFLEPRQSIHFSEYWMPVRTIGGITRANLSGVLSLRREGGRLVAGFNANRAVAGAKVKLLDGARVLKEETVDLAPERVWTLELPDAPKGPLTFELADAAGRELMRQTEGVYDWTPEKDVTVGPRPHPPAGGALDAGTDLELNGDLLGAYQTYEQALERTPDDQSLLVAAGRLAAALLRYPDAVRLLEPAQARATYDGEIAYYLGLAYDGLGRTREARLEYETARREPQFRAAGSLKLAELVARQGDTEHAAQYLAEAPADPRTREELAILHGKALAPEGSRAVESAAACIRLGRWRQALTILSREYPQVPIEQTEPGPPLPQKDPVAAYYRAYCHGKLHESAAADYEIAAKLPTAYVFPSGAETLTVLETAVHERSQDATAHFLLGTLWMASGQVDDAIAEWNRAKNLNPAIPVLDADLGRTLLRIKHDVPAAAEAFRAGLSVDASNTELYTGLSTALALMAKPAAETAAVLERYPDRAGMPTSMVYDLALSDAEAGRFAEAKALFEGRYFAREEGGLNVRQIWIRVRALEAESLARGGHCSEALDIVDHLGAPVAGFAFTRDGLESFLKAAPSQVSLGEVENLCGRPDRAAARVRSMAGESNAGSLVFAYELARQLPGFQAAEWTARLEAARTPGRESSWSSLISAMLQVELGHTEEGRALLETALFLPDRNLAHHFSRQMVRRVSQK